MMSLDLLLMIVALSFFFFFSSRRRHTRFDCDWSSDVCSSDLLPPQVDILLVLYSTAFIRDWETPDAAEVAWEQEGLEASQPGSRVALAEICPSSTSHLKTHFRLSAGQFPPYTSRILVDD